MPSIEKHSCANCAQRKVKCDKLSPCSNCSKSQSECLYRAPALSQRHRKRPPDEDLLSKISEYEDLLRKNNVKFRPLDNSWVPSPLEEKLVSRPQTARLGSCTALQAPGETERPPAAQGAEQQPQSEFATAQSEAARLWSGLPKELRDSPIEQLKRPRKDLEDEVTETKLNSGLATSLLIPVCLSGAPQPLELHPEPKHIFKLWQAFAESVNPLTKVVYTPTFQQRILEVSWNLETVTKPLEAVMFSVYALAITSMKPADCIQAFGETRSVLLSRYRSGAAQALIAAELHSTRELEVLQALVLFLLLDSRSELSVTVVAIATRIGYKMGLHRTGADPHMPFFEQEMRLRVWWQIMALESRARRKSLGLTSSMAEYGDVRMPMNINDADLHPHMANRPTVEHPGPTEMLFCLMKYELEQYARSPRTVAAATNTNPYELVASTSPTGMAGKRKVLADLERIYEDKYLRHCDPAIPLHHISTTVAGLTIHRVRFWAYHPRHQPDGGRHTSPADRDLVFASSVRLLQLDHDVRATTFSPHLLEHLHGCTQTEALVYMLSELRQRVRGDLVRTAWALVGRMYDEYPQLLQRHDGDKFYTALADLTLAAWEARSRDEEACGDAVPGFIGVLQAMKVDEDAPIAVVDEGMLPDGGFQFDGLIQDDPLDWVYWNELPSW